MAAQFVDSNHELDEATDFIFEALKFLEHWFELENSNSKDKACRPIAASIISRLKNLGLELDSYNPDADIPISINEIRNDESDAEDELKHKLSLSESQSFVCGPEKD